MASADPASPPSRGPAVRAGTGARGSATYDATVDTDVVSITIIVEEGWPDDFTVLVSEEDGYLVVVGCQ